MVMMMVMMKMMKMMKMMMMMMRRRRNEEEEDEDDDDEGCETNFKYIFKWHQHRNGSRSELIMCSSAAEVGGIIIWRIFSQDVAYNKEF